MPSVLGALPAMWWASLGPRGLVSPERQPLASADSQGQEEWAPLRARHLWKASHVSQEGFVRLVSSASCHRCGSDTESGTLPVDVPQARRTPGCLISNNQQPTVFTEVQPWGSRMCSEFLGGLRSAQEGAETLRASRPPLVQPSLTGGDVDCTD